jgi:hypothetical protein
MIAREDQALPAESQRPPLSFPEQPDGKPPELPRLHFPQEPGGQGPAPAPGGYPAPAPGGYPPPTPDAPDRQAPPTGPGNPPGTPPGWAPRWGNVPQRGGPGGPRPGRPARPTQPLRPPETALRQRAVAALILGVLSVLALLGVGSNFHRGIYLVIFALAVGIGACWLGITAMQRARRSVSMRPRGAVAGIVLGVIGALLSAVLLLAFAAFWRQLTSYSQCLNEANTPSAQQACVNQLHHSVGISKLPG